MAQDQISMSLAAALRASNPSQPNTVAEIKYSSLRSTARDHVPIQAPRKHQVTARVTTFGTVQAGWQRDVIQRYQHELVDHYDVVLCTDVDEIVAPDPRLGDLGTYIDRFDENFITCQGYEVLHRKDHEPPFDPTRPVLAQRFTWYANPSYSKPLLARVPMLWHGGFHERVDGKKNHDPNLYLIHLHRMDYDICWTRHQDRTRFPLAQIDRNQGWGYQNQITDPGEFSSWFFHDSCGPSPIHPQPIPPWWHDLV